MASSIKLLCMAMMFINLFVAGICQPCTIKDIKIEQSKTGKLVNNKPEWIVSVKNLCICSQSNLELDCKGFRSVKPIDPSLLGFPNSIGQCLVNTGLPVYGFHDFNFSYAWDTSFPLTPLSSSIACS